MSRLTKPTQADAPVTPAALQQLAKVAASDLRRRSRLRPQLAIILGSGYEHIEKEITTVLEVPYEKLPGFPPAGVAGHAGRLLIGYLNKVPVLILSGRTHFYEGHSLERITFPIRMMAAYGVDSLVMTNAAGGINKKLRPGNLMVVSDHINLMGGNPLRAWNLAEPTRFVDLSQAYSTELNAQLIKAGAKHKLKLQSGVYLAVSGPSYETPAEIRAFARLGADAIGMSTVPEIIVANQCGIRSAALSCITNQAAGLSRKPIRHDDVMATAKQVEGTVAALLKSFVELYEPRSKAKPD